MTGGGIMKGGDLAYHCSSMKCEGWRWQVLADAQGENTCLKCGSRFLPKATLRPGRAPSAGAGQVREARAAQKGGAAQAARAKAAPKATQGQKGARKEDPWAKGPKAPKDPQGDTRSATVSSATELVFRADTKRKECPLYKAEMEHRFTVGLHGAGSAQAAETARRLQGQQTAAEAALPASKRIAALQRRVKESEGSMEKQSLRLDDLEAQIMTLHQEMDVGRAALKKAQHDHQLLQSSLQEAIAEAQQAREQDDNDDEDDGRIDPKDFRALMRAWEDVVRSHPAMVEDELREEAINLHSKMERFGASIGDWAEASGSAEPHATSYSAAPAEGGGWTVKGKGKKGKGKWGGTPAVAVPQTLQAQAPSPQNPRAREDRSPSPKRAKGVEDDGDAEMLVATEAPSQARGDGSAA